MIPVVIVDDEPIIRNGISKIIPWEKYGCELVGTARNGVEALKVITEKKAKIVISDIKMPKMNGLELLDKIREMKLDVTYIIVSGYDEFQYAQKAINNGAFYYLLKPIVPEELEHIIYKAAIASGWHKDEDIMVQEEGFGNARAMMWLPEYIQGTLSRSDKEKYKDLIEHEKYLWHLIVAVSANREDEEAGAVQQLETAIHNANLEDSSIIFSDRAQNSYAVFSKSGQAEFAKPIEKLINAWNGMNNGGAITISRITSGLAAVPELFSEIRKIAAFQRIFNIKYADTKVWEEAFSKWQKETPANKEYIINSIFAGEKGNIESLIDSILNSGWEDTKIKWHSKMLLFLIYNSLSRFDKQWETEQIQRMPGLSVSIDQASKNGISTILKEQLNLAICRLTGNSISNTKIAVARAKAIVKLNYADETLSLSSVSNMLGFNPTYFSHIFSSVAQQGFSNYLTKVRIEKAKSLLNNNEKVENIAGMVGYTNQPYFSTRFKKETGVSPSDYRNQVSERK